MSEVHHIDNGAPLFVSCPRGTPKSYCTTVLLSVSLLYFPYLTVVTVEEHEFSLPPLLKLVLHKGALDRLSELPAHHHQVLHPELVVQQRQHVHRALPCCRVLFLAKRNHRKACRKVPTPHRQCARHSLLLRSQEYRYLQR